MGHQRGFRNMSSTEGQRRGWLVLGGMATSMAVGWVWGWRGGFDWWDHWLPVGNQCKRQCGSSWGA